MIIYLLQQSAPWHVDLVDYLDYGIMPSDLNFGQRKWFISQAKSYFWEDPCLFKNCGDGLIRKCVPEDNTDSIISHCHCFPC